jgi:hypothetical protein
MSHATARSMGARDVAAPAPLPFGGGQSGTPMERAWPPKGMHNSVRQGVSAHQRQRRFDLVTEGKASGGVINDQNQFELYLADAPDDAAAVAYHAPAPAATTLARPRLPALVVREADGVIWASVNPGGIEQLAGPSEAALGMRVVRRGLSSRLALHCPLTDVHVNGLPALSLTILAVKDSLLMAGSLYYVTQRVQPLVGAPEKGLLGKKCLMCRLPLDAQTRVVTCHCGGHFHHETLDSHPHVPDTDRLDCFSKIEACLACGRTLTTSDYLLWYPLIV